MGLANELTGIRASRDVWSHGQGSQLRDLISSALLTLLILPDSNRPAYFSSPWISDFVLFDNQFRQFGSIFPGIADSGSIRFREYLRHLSRQMKVRIITTRTDTSLAFLKSFDSQMKDVAYKFAPDEYHEKGILAPSFYIEGSMNITYNGLYVRDEKITYHVPTTTDGREKVSSAYLEFNRRWEVLS